MTEPGPRVAYWMDVCSQVMLRPLTKLPEDFLMDRLTETFRVTAVTHNWREPDGRFGFDVNAPQLVPLHAWMMEAMQTERLLDQHPLIMWYAATGSVRPWTSARVPSSIVSARTRERTESWLRTVEGERQLSISYRLAGTMHRAFVLGRAGRDFDDEDLVVAGYVQRSLRGLDHQLELVRRLQPAGAEDRLLDLGLTVREYAVLQLVARGLSTRSIGRRLNCSPRTVEKHLEHSYRKLGVKDRVNAVRVAQLAGVIDDPARPRDGDGCARGGVPTSQRRTLTATSP